MLLLNIEHLYFISLFYIPLGIVHSYSDVTIFTLCTCTSRYHIFRSMLSAYGHSSEVSLTCLPQHETSIFKVWMTRLWFSLLNAKILKPIGNLSSLEEISRQHIRDLIVFKLYKWYIPCVDSDCTPIPYTGDNIHSLITPIHIMLLVLFMKNLVMFLNTVHHEAQYILLSPPNSFSLFVFVLQHSSYLRFVCLFLQYSSLPKDIYLKIPQTLKELFDWFMFFGCCF